MAADTKLWNKASGKKIYCDRYYNLINPYTEVRGVDETLTSVGLSKLILVDICEDLKQLFLFAKKYEIYDEILEGLSKFNDEDMFVLIYDSNDEYYK